jgi:hypothetical protein
VTAFALASISASDNVERQQGTETVNVILTREAGV